MLSYLKLKLRFPSFKNIFLIFLISAHSNTPTRMLLSKREQCPQPSWSLGGNICLPLSHFHGDWGAVWGWMHLHLSPVPLVILFHWNKNRSIWKTTLISVHLILIYQAGQGGDEAQYWRANCTPVSVLTHPLCSARHGLIKQSWLCVVGGKAFPAATAVPIGKEEGPGWGKEEIPASP